MTERHPVDRPEGGAHEGAGGAVDHELDIRGILIFVFGLIGVTLVVLALMWGLAKHEKASLVKKDPPPPALEAARETYVPPGPNLQRNPSADMAAFRAAEELDLTNWAWVDKEKGVARVPALRAMEIVLSRGLPTPPPMPPPVPVEAPQ
ncbi:MAG: hypothetical protein PT977_03780 [Acidobacteriota bacterium]|nr:hypothetical protein [Acidobacteriota bacterium]